ncbi:DEAD/DEAH box helicase [Chlamydia suis]|uniref:DEAD/DEAH box helicase n=2 Tax=Chlamydia suis TaxID=83559 RepID=UPI001E2B4051|nr:DEAD/DEAH box helicase [Chlamydia suis]
MSHKSFSILTVQEQGKEFEKYCKWLLECDPKYKLELKEVWLQADCPMEIKRKLNLQQDTKDRGIDLVAETYTGEFWAIQCKCYDPQSSIQRRDIDSFLSFSAKVDESLRARFSLRLLLHTAPLSMSCKFEINSQGNVSSQYLKVEEFDRWRNSRISLLRPQLKTPRFYQEEAICAIEEGFATHDKGRIYMACGTGKSLVGLWVVQKLQCKYTLVLVPSIALVDQMFREWANNSDFYTFRPIFVCSDDTVGKKRKFDDEGMSVSELGFPVTTDPTRILELLKKEPDVPKIIFSTYQSSPKLFEACEREKDLIFDLVLADEAHRCAGKVETAFSTVHRLRTRRRLFMTATPRIYSTEVKTRSKNQGFEIISMDDDEKFGPLFYQLPFSQAIDKDLLCDYEVVIPLMSHARYRKYAEEGTFVHGEGIGEEISDHGNDARTLASQILIAKTMKQYHLQRTISYHSRTADAKKFADTFEAALEKIDQNQRPEKINTSCIFGYMTQGHRANILRDFKLTKEVSVIANVHCLSEGVDLPILNGIAFVDPKGSHIEIIQAVGRAIRQAPDKEKGYIIVPVLLDADIDLMDEDNIEQAFESSCFGPVWNVLKALKTHDDMVSEQLDNLRIEMGRGRLKNPAKLLDKVTVILNDALPIDGAEFANSLSPKILPIFNRKVIKQISDGWYEQFGALLDFREEHGHCKVPKRYPQNPSLGVWVCDQRKKFKKGRLAEDKIARLEELGFVWDILEEAWEENFLELQRFREEHGHCNVPSVYPQNPSLGVWVSNQRSHFKKCKLSEDRIARLEEIGFVWDVTEEAWEENFLELKRFQEEHGHCNVPRWYPENPDLGSWVKAQRKTFKSGELSEDRIARLEELGFVWDVFEEVWEKNFLELKRFREEHGHCKVPWGYPQNPSLGVWVKVQRKTFKSGELSEDRIARLEELGFVWDVTEEAWEKNFLELKRFQEGHGHCKVPNRYPQNPFLGVWVCDQRERFKKGKLAEDRIARLEELGFVWYVTEEAWEKNFLELKRFREEHGHCKVPVGYPQNLSLGVWVSNQRVVFKKGKLSEDKIARLKELGFVWDVFEEVWEKNFLELKRFQEEHGHCKVPERYPQNPDLGSWVSNQRVDFKKGDLSEDRIVRLEELGFVWYVLEEEWEKNFLELQRFREEHGHCKVPASYPQNPQLASWVSTQRADFKEGKLAEDKIARLAELGFVWRVFEEAWEENFLELQRFREEHGHCNVPSVYPQNPFLGVWVCVQRKRFKKGKLAEDRVARLEEIGFVWDVLEEEWKKNFLELKRFREEHGHCKVPQRYPQNPSLGVWVGDQRERFKKGKLAEDRIARLEEIGFVWDVLEEEWEENFLELKRFQEEHRHCKVPEGYPQNPQLASWVSNQRQYFRKGKLAKDRIARLEEIGFVWRVLEEEWEENFLELKCFREEHGHCKVPYKYPKSPQLSVWVSHQRKDFKKGKLSEDRIVRLEELGFVWRVLEEEWEENFLELKRFQEEHGHCNVPHKYPQNPQLAVWVSHQRADFKEGKLAEDKIARLEELGFVWRVLEEAWEKNFLELKRFREEHGHCKVPGGYPQNPQLAVWVRHQRADFKEGKLAEDKIARLEELGFVWDVLKEVWEKNFLELQRFREEHGHCKVPGDYPQNPQLASWVSNQRYAFKKGELSEDKIVRLEELGFVWDVLKEVWEENFLELQRFLEEHGHCKVPQRYPQNPFLGTWVSHQRQDFKEDKLSEDRIARLEELGFVWDVLEESWEKNFLELKRFREEHGHCKVPYKYPKSPQLSVWVRHQRENFKKGDLSEDGIKRMNELGFVWDVLEESWEKNFLELKRFQEEHGHCKVPQRYPQNPDLGSWVSVQRKTFKSSELSEDRIARLEELGFVWDVLEEEWEKNFLELKRFREEYGHCKVPARYPQNPSLGVWVCVQRIRFKEGKLAEDRVARLEELGFVWNVLKEAWEENFLELQRFREEHGHCKVPHKYPKSPQLSVWVSNQRKDFKKGDLSEDRIARLEELGFVWRVREEAR